MNTFCRFITLTFAMAYCAILHAQPPALIPYQAIARDASGQPLANVLLSARFTIHQGGAQGPVVWQEMQTVTTNELGLFSSELGNSVSLNVVNWHLGPMFLQAELNTGNGFFEIGTKQLLSVPYALHAGNVYLNVSATGDTLFVGNGSFAIIPGISEANDKARHSCGAANVHNRTIPYGTLTDQEGNVYKTVIIGTQEWMAENLNTSIYRNGDSIIHSVDNQDWSFSQFDFLGRWSWYNNDQAYECPYGKLYNNYACLDARHLCPVGWHVPSDSDWNTLINFLDPFAFGGDIANVAGTELKSTGTLQGGNGYWSAFMGETPTNSSGFSALPGGWRVYEGQFYDMQQKGRWWSGTSTMSTEAYMRTMYYNLPYAYSDADSKSWGCSVRCVRNEGNTFVPGCTNYDACNYNSLATIDDGTCYSAGDSCDDADSTTVNDVWTADCVCEGTLVLSGAPHTCGADQVHNAFLVTGTLIDQEGNSYKTITIGSQEWMAENLITSTYLNGDSIPELSVSSQWAASTTGAFCYYNNDSTIACPHGKLYNWFACVDPRGLCPSGWHIPSNAEWNTLINNVDPTASSGINLNNIAAGALKSAGTIQAGTGWWYAPNTGAINSSGFSALPSGARDNNAFYYQFGYYTAYWSNASYDANRAWYLGIDHDNDNVYPVTLFNKKGGHSVRCLRD